MSPRLQFIACILFASVGLAAAQEPEANRMIWDQPCPEHKIPGDVACKTLDIAENPLRPDARTISIRIMILRAEADEPEPDPLFVIPGGPGQSIIQEANLRQFFAEFFGPVRKRRDIVFVDQRGTGGSNPLNLEPSENMFFVRPEMNIPPEWGPPALKGLRTKADLTQYTTARATEDLDAVRRALGYRPINLYGTSYGVRVVQHYIKRHGKNVRSAVLKGVTPPPSNIALSYGRNSQRALEKLFALCAADKGCAEAYPDLKGDFRSVLDRLEREPVTVDTKNPFTNAPLEFTITRGNFAFGVRSLMMNAAAFVQLPQLIAQAKKGNFAGWAPFLVRVRLLYATRLYGGMSFSVIATEDVPRLTEKAIRADAQGTFIGDALARGFAELGDFWPQGSAPADLFTPLKSDVPILLVSGALDPATPPEGAESMLEGLPNGHHVVYAGGAHSAANFTGLDQIIAEFIRMGSADKLDLSAAEANRPPPFSLPE